MRINKYIAERTDLSRRSADEAIAQNRVKINGALPQAGQQVAAGDTIELDGHVLESAQPTITIMFNKPVGYVCSRDGQGSKTIYDILPAKYAHLNAVGRLDKDSSGLLLLTNDGQLHQTLTHPKYKKPKVYVVTLNKELSQTHATQLQTTGVDVGDNKPSKLHINPIPLTLYPMPYTYEVRLTEGRNRQIRRSFNALGYLVTSLHRTQFGPYKLASLPPSGQKKI